MFSKDNGASHRSKAVLNLFVRQILQLPKIKSEFKLVTKLIYTHQQYASTPTVSPLYWLMCTGYVTLLSAVSSPGIPIP